MSPEETRSLQFNVRLTPSEIQTVQRLAELSSLSATELIRRLVRREGERRLGIPRGATGASDVLRFGFRFQHEDEGYPGDTFTAQLFFVPMKYLTGGEIVGTVVGRNGKELQRGEWLRFFSDGSRVATAVHPVRQTVVMFHDSPIRYRIVGSMDPEGGDPLRVHLRPETAEEAKSVTPRGR